MPTPPDDSTRSSPDEVALARSESADPVEAHFDAVVVCTGPAKSTLLSRLGWHLPTMPVHGWSIAAPIRMHEAHPDHGPRAAVIDERTGVAIGRIGNRVRVSGDAQLGGRAEGRDVPDALYRALDHWFPGALHTNHLQCLAGARPTTPDGLPLLGASGLEGIWLNLGHGGSGWPLASGAARLVADGIAHRSPAVDSEGLGLDRWGR